MLSAPRGQDCWRPDRQTRPDGNPDPSSSSHAPFRPRQTPRSPLQKLKESVSPVLMVWQGAEQPIPLCFLNSGVNFPPGQKFSSTPPPTPFPFEPHERWPMHHLRFHFAPGNAHVSFPRVSPSATVHPGTATFQPFHRFPSRPTLRASCESETEQLPSGGLSQPPL